MVSNCPKGQRQKHQPILVNDTNGVYHRGMYTGDRWKRRKWSIFRAGLRKFSQTAEHVKGVWKEELESDVEHVQAPGAHRVMPHAEAGGGSGRLGQQKQEAGRDRREEATLQGIPLGAILLLVTLQQIRPLNYSASACPVTHSDHSQLS